MRKELTEKEIRKAAQQSGSKGGMTTMNKYGKEHFSKIAKQRWDKKKAEKVLGPLYDIDGKIV